MARGNPWPLIAALLAGGALIGTAGAQTAPPTQAALTDQQSRCLAEAAKVRSDYMRHFGGDHVQYDFGARSESAAALCREGKVDEARDLMAAIRFDIRALYNEQRILFGD